MNRVLVTGCAGFIGSHLIEALLSRDFEVVGVDNFDPFYDRKVKEKNLQVALSMENFKFIEGDLANDEVYGQIGQIDAVIHLAAKAGVRPSIEDPIGYSQSNIIATQKLLNWMVQTEVKKFIFASSSSVYGNCTEVPFHEDLDVSSPISPYAFSKKSCELMNYVYHDLYNIDVLNLRFFTVYGPRQRPDLAIHKFTRMITNNEAITLYGDGTTYRDYTYIDDIVRGVSSALEFIQENTNIYDTVNIGSNNPIKLIDLAKILFQELGADENIEYLPMQSGDVDGTYASITRARTLFNYAPRVSFQEGIHQFVNWWSHK